MRRKVLPTTSYQGKRSGEKGGTHHHMWEVRKDRSGSPASDQLKGQIGHPESGPTRREGGCEVSHKDKNNNKSGAGHESDLMSVL